MNRTKLSSESKEQLSRKQGPHGCIHLPNGNRYIGNWKNNERSGKGLMYYKNGNQYDGEWKEDVRSGAGILSVSIEPVIMPALSSVFEGNAKNSRHQNDRMRKVYAGMWMNDKPHGDGIHYYLDGRVYTGSFQNGLKDGWGHMKYSDGNVYEGEYLRDNRHGQGVLLIGNGDRYEGMWFADMKEGDHANVNVGPGKYVHLKKRQCFEGEWSRDMAKCGTLVDLKQTVGYTRTYQLPIVTFTPNSSCNWRIPKRFLKLNFIFCTKSEVKG